MSSSGHSPIDWDRVERWARQIVANDASEISAEFPTPTRPSFVWDPAPETLISDKLQFLHRYWMDLKGARAIPNYRAVDPLNMGPILGYVVLLEPVDGDRDFRFRIFGSLIASVSEFDLTGQLASALIASTKVVEFGLASYRASMRRTGALYTVRTPIGAYRTAQWHRLTMPLADDAGRIARLIAVSLPMSRGGTLVG